MTRIVPMWDVHGRGFDPTRDDQQPYFGDTPQSDRDALRRWAHNLRLMLDAGVDPMKQMIDRCRQKGISPWVSVRINDYVELSIRFPKAR